MIKNNKGPVSPIARQGGFTLVETMFAVMILTFTIVSMMTVVANSLFAARYARDDITVSYLLQESIDAIRNDRDTSVFLQSGDIDTAWSTFVSKYANCLDSSRGCYFEVLTSSPPVTCPLDGDGGCPQLCYDSSAINTSYYVSENTLSRSCPDNDMIKSNFIRKIVVTDNGDEINVVVTISWMNGNLSKSRSLETTFMKWQS